MMADEPGPGLSLSSPSSWARGEYGAGREDASDPKVMLAWATSVTAAARMAGRVKKGGGQSARKLGKGVGLRHAGRKPEAGGAEGPAPARWTTAWVSKSLLFEYRDELE